MHSSTLRRLKPSSRSNLGIDYLLTAESVGLSAVRSGKAAIYSPGSKKILPRWAMVNWPKSSRIRCSDPGRRLITWSLSYDSLSGPAMMAHVYGPAAEAETIRRNDPPVIWLTEKNASVPNPIEGQ